MSDGPSARNHRITKPDFRPCPRCLSRSQPPLCLCTLKDGFQPSRGQPWAPPIPFWRRPPQSNCPSGAVRAPGHGAALGPRRSGGGIPQLAPPEPRFRHQCLPPILCALRLDPTPDCSKALRGLSVLSRVTRIFTGSTISPGVSSRQRSNRYAFRAGQNLPDKEFRYLRTVIVTAAVYWGLDLRLRANPERAS